MSIDDLSDDEIRARLEQRGHPLGQTARLVRDRDESAVRAFLARILAD